MKPVIGIASNLLIDSNEKVKNPIKISVEEDYIQAVLKTGGIPLVIPVQQNMEDLKEIVSRMDGILLIGGNDINPLLYDEKPTQRLGKVLPHVDIFYVELLHAADALGKPVFGICKGLQAMNVAFGGTLYQDLKDQKASQHNHVQSCDRCQFSHTCILKAGSSLCDILQAEKIPVNSFHHQAVKDLAKGFAPVAFGEDGIIEAIERTGGTYMLGVQWHPEMLIVKDEKNSLQLMKSFISRCAKTKEPDTPSQTEERKQNR